MARYAYDVNTTQRYIDVHKQFRGGLKTVDTDDALGAVFLREAENVSLSEFGFIEKRYGTYKIDKFLDGTDGKIQGYWEYYEEDGSVNEIAIFGGKLFLRKQGETSFTEITNFRKEGNFQYDDSIFGTGVVTNNYISQNYIEGAVFSPDTGEQVSSVGNGATQKINLKDLEGFNVLNELKILSYDDYSYLVFWDENNDYIGYFGSPLAQEYELAGESIDLSGKKLGPRPVLNQLFTVPLDAAYMALVMDNTTFELNEQNKFVWGQESAHNFTDFSSLVIVDTIGGTTYPLVPSLYPFQSTKDVSGVLIKDYFYIFNGTYPIYYKGGSSFYIFPMYAPSSVDIINAGHNFLETRDFEEVYGYEGEDYTLDTSNNFLDPSLDFEIEPENSQALPLTPRVSFTKQEWYPKLPYAINKQEKGELSFELNYNYSKEVAKIFDPYLYGSSTTLPLITDSDVYTNVNYALKLDSISFAGANAASNNEYVKINPELIESTGVISNYVQALEEDNLTFSQFRVRDEFGLFRDLVSEDNLNAIPSQTHGVQQDPANPVLNTAEEKRNFLGKERRHPFGIDQLWVNVNVRELSISIEESVIRTPEPESGNLAGELYGIRFKRDVTTNDINYEKLDFKDLFGFQGSDYGVLAQSSFITNFEGQKVTFSFYADQVGVDAAIDKYLSNRFAVIIRPITAGYAVEDKTHWKLLYDSSDCYFQNQMLYFKMPEFEDRIDNEAVTGYAIDIKTVNFDEINTSKKREDYLTNYSGKASRSIRTQGQETGILGLRDLWPGLGATRSKLDYNMFAAVTPQFSSNPFGSAFKATITELLPGTYDFKVTFALDETKVSVIQPYQEEGYQGDYVSTTTYQEDDIVRVFEFESGDVVQKYYKSKENSNFNNYPPSNSDELDEWELVDFRNFYEENSISTDTQYISVYFRNIQIFGEKVNDFRTVKENGKSPILSCTRAVEHYGKLLVYGSEELKEAVFVSFPENFNYFPTLFKLDFNTEAREQVQAVTPFMNVLVVQTLSRSWGIKGSSPLVNSPYPYSTFMISPSYGTIAPKSVHIVRNQLLFLSHLGVVSLNSLYAVDEMYNVKFEDLNIRNIVPQDTKAVGIQYDNQYWLNFPESGITLRWYIDKKAWVQDKYTAWGEGFKGVFKWQIVNGQLEFITYPSQFKLGENLAIYKVGVDYTLPTDLTERIKTRIETSFLNQNYPFHPKNYKEAKLDFTLQNEYNISKETLYNKEDIILTDGVRYLDNVNLVKNHRYRVYFYDMPVGTEGATIGVYPTSQTEDPVYSPFVEPTSNYFEFVIPNAVTDGVYDIKVEFYEGVTVGPLSLDLRDATYDNALTFLTWIVSEDNTLNQDPIQNYDQAKAEIDFSLQDKFGDWEFGETNFGKTTTAVKTIKLSGKGYNAKLYMEDFSKSKWTLESLGLTYKMKRARSR